MRGSGSAGDVSAWEVYQYFYCPRKLYFIRKLGLYPPERKKMKAGGEEHGSEHRRVKRRKTIYGFPEEEVDRVLKDIPLADEGLGLFGRADTVLRLKTGELIPVDVKYSDLSFVSLPWRKQIVAYSVLLEKKFGTRIKRGLIMLLPSKRVLWVSVSVDDKRALTQDLERMRRVTDSDAIPPKVSPEKCGYCEVKKFCKRS